MGIINSPANRSRWRWGQCLGRWSQGPVIGPTEGRESQGKEQGGNGPWVRERRDHGTSCKQNKQ